MAAPKGNKFWEARSSHGANPKFAHESDLWDACLQYFEWVHDNPLHEGKVVAGKVTSVPKMRAMTIVGLCVFLDISHSTWKEWRKSRNDLSAIIERVEQIIRTQKFEGAAAELLNPNIIARDLGLADNTNQKTEHDISDNLAAVLDAVDGKTKSV